MHKMKNKMGINQNDRSLVVVARDMERIFFLFFSCTFFSNFSIMSIY